MHNLEVNMRKLIVCVPSRDSWAAQFGMALFYAGVHFTANGSGDGHVWEFEAQTRLGSCICSNRTELVMNALSKGATHILFLDDDMGFPRDTFERLLAHDKDIVAANCVTKELPPRATAATQDLQRIYTLPSSSGLEEVYTVGTGIMLIKAEVFESIPQPWFIETWEDDKGHFTGEDRNFCMTARKAGYKVYIDHDLSKQVQHVGQLSHSHAMTLPWIAEEKGDMSLLEHPERLEVRK